MPSSKRNANRTKARKARQREDANYAPSSAKAIGLEPPNIDIDALALIFSGVQHHSRTRCETRKVKK